MRKCSSNIRQKYKKNATKHKEHDMLRMMEHDVNLGITKTQEHVKCAKRSKMT